MKEGSEATDKRGKKQEEKKELVPLSSLSSLKSQLKLRKMNMTLASSLGVSENTIHTILHEDLITSKMSAR